MKFESFEFDGLWEHPYIKYYILDSLFLFKTIVFLQPF